MNILICLKQVPDTGVRIKLHPLTNQKNNIDTDGFEWIINPYDEFALEEALRIKDKNPETKITVLSLGSARVEKALRTALAMGADRACLIQTDKQFGPSQVSQVLSAFIKTEPYDLILMGKSGIDENHSATGAMLAERLQLPHVGFVTKLTPLEEKSNTWVCTRQINSGIQESITLCLPALLTIEKAKNQARYPSLPGIIKAKKKELKKISLDSLIPSLTESPVFDSYHLPKTGTSTCTFISGSPEEQVKKLVYALKTQSKVI